MRFKDKIVDGAGIITLKGKLMGPPDTDELQNEIKSMLGQNIKNIVLDLSGVSWINSIGMGAIMRAHTTISNSQGKLSLANISDKVNSLLLITQLQKIFDTHESVEAAIRNLKA